MTNKDHQFFVACTTIRVGDAKKTSFWHAGWLQGRRPKDIAPGLYAISSRKNRRIADALDNHNWILDLNFVSVLMAWIFQDCVTLEALIRQVPRDPELEDTIRWKLTKSRQYTVSSAYKAQFIGSTKETWLRSIWDVWHLRNVNTLCGLYYKTGSGLLIDSLPEVGTTTLHAPSATRS